MHVSYRCTLNSFIYQYYNRILTIKQTKCCNINFLLIQTRVGKIEIEKKKITSFQLRCTILMLHLSLSNYVQNKLGGTEIEIVTEIIFYSYKKSSK